jgi:hypothetical protein
LRKFISNSNDDDELDDNPGRRWELNLARRARIRRKENELADEPITPQPHLDLDRIQVEDMRIEQL